MEEENSEESTLASLPIIRTELRVLTSRTTKFNNQLRTQKKFIISELGAQDNRITELSEKNQVLVRHPCLTPAKRVGLACTF